MPYPDSAPTVDEIENNPVLKREILVTINNKPKEGFKRIHDICEQNGLGETERNKKMAGFFLSNKNNLDLGAVADHIGSDTQSELLKQCVNEYAPMMKGKDFTQALRDYFETFQTPGEAQKVDRFVRDFAYAYAEQNPDQAIPSGDAAYQMAFQAIMLSTDAHTPGIKHKMTFDQLKDNLQYSMKVQKIDGAFLETKGLLDQYYKDLTTTPLPSKFQKQEPRLELNAAQLGRDKMLKSVDKALGQKQGDVAGALGLEGTSAKVEGRKPMLSILTGYKSTITIKDQAGNEAKVEIVKPGLFSGKKPSVTIKPVGESEGGLKLAGRIASRFDSTATAKASFGYQRDDMSKPLKQENQGQKTGLKAGKEVEKGLTVEKNQPKESVGTDRVKLSREGYRGAENLKIETAQKEVMNELSQVLGKGKQKVEEGVSVAHASGLKKVGERGTGKELQINQGQRKGISN